MVPYSACFHFIGLFCYKALTVNAEKMCKKALFKGSSYKMPKVKNYFLVNPIQYGLFLKHYGMGGIMAPLVTSLFLEVEGQNLVAWGILMCLLQKWH